MRGKKIFNLIPISVSRTHLHPRYSLFPLSYTMSVKGPIYVCVFANSKLLCYAWAHNRVLYWERDKNIKANKKVKKKTKTEKYDSQLYICTFRIARNHPMCPLHLFTCRFFSVLCKNTQFTKNQQNTQKPFRNSEQRKNKHIFWERKEANQWSKNKLIPSQAK